MRLSELLHFDNIIVQCHNNPDADALASGMAVTEYFKRNNKNVCFIYGGKFEIQKSNLLFMIDELKIDIKHVKKQEQLAHLLGLKENDLPGLLLTVDCQYGEGNVQKFEADEVAVIDHHQISGPLPELSEVRPYQASCATVVWDMMEKEGVEVNEIKDLPTALYYGLMTDSGNFTELYHPLDMDMRDDLRFNSADIIKFKNANISQEELRIAGIALLGAEYYKENRYSIVKTDPCDPNILGMISDMLLEVDDVDTCLVYSVLDSGVKISVRSCVKEVKANELADFICDGVGDGGGHTVKAGGFLKRNLLEKQELEYDPSDILEFFRDRMEEYFMDNEIIYSTEYVADPSEMEEYVKKRTHLGYVKGTDIVPVGSEATIRTLEGDIDILIKDDTYIVIGIKGEIHPVEKKRFEENYELSDEEYVYPGDYDPQVKDLLTGKNLDILSFTHSCISTGAHPIYARELNHRTKVFTRWDEDKYYLGKPGDYLVASENDLSDVYVIERAIFKKTYKKI